MLLEHGAASNDTRTVRDDGFGQPIHVSGALRANPTHQVLSSIEVLREAAASHFEDQVEVLFVPGGNAGKQTPRETPLAKEVVGGSRLHRLVSDHADGFGETEISVDHLAADLRIGQCRVEQTESDGGTLDLGERHRDKSDVHSDHTRSIKQVAAGSCVSGAADARSLAIAFIERPGFFESTHGTGYRA